MLFSCVYSGERGEENFRRLAKIAKLEFFELNL
jgi:hypothetical protein